MVSRAAAAGNKPLASQKQGFKGVRMRAWGKWVSEIRLPNTRARLWLGSFATAQQAARAFDVAMVCLRGRSASLNFPDSPPQYAPLGLPHHQIVELAAAAAQAAAPGPAPDPSSPSNSPAQNSVPTAPSELEGSSDQSSAYCHRNSQGISSESATAIFSCHDDRVDSPGTTSTTSSDLSESGSSATDAETSSNCDQSTTLLYSELPIEELLLPLRDEATIHSQSTQSNLFAAGLQKLQQLGLPDNFELGAACVQLLDHDLIDWPGSHSSCSYLYADDAHPVIEPSWELADSLLLWSF